MKWNLRMRAAQVGIWKSTEMRRRLAEAGLEVSAGKMSALWTGTPTTVRLDDLEVICAVLDCGPSDLLIVDEVSVTARRAAAAAPAAANDGPNTGPAPRLGRRKSLPPA
jgi:DNA-binding Xre family transcriptional regulator